MFPRFAMHCGLSLTVLSGCSGAREGAVPGASPVAPVDARADCQTATPNLAEDWEGRPTTVPDCPRPLDGAGAVGEPSPSPPRAPELPPAATDGALRITAVKGFERIFMKPVWSAPVIGMFRAGQSVTATSKEPLTGPGVARCAGGWYAIAPRGYVCVGDASTLAVDDLRAAAAALVLPDRSSATGYHVGTSTGAPIYLRVPTRAEQRATEPGLDAHLASPPAPDDALGGAVDALPSGKAPPEALTRYLATADLRLVDERDAYEGMRVAWAHELDAEGRTWLLTPDLGLVPKDKVRARSTPALASVDLRSGAVRLPLAYLWLGEAPKLSLEASVPVDTGQSWPRQAFVPVDPKLVRTREGGLVRSLEGPYLRRDRVTIIEAAKGRPRGVGPKAKWVSVRVTHGYLVAYEGDTPVLVSAISPGVDGVSPRGFSTPPGLYAIYAKAFSWDMAGVEKGKPWKVDEVPWVAFYKGNYALHGAWWHDDFGRPKSHGCVNLPPLAARAIFDWLDPAVPEGWYTAGAYYPEVPGTIVEVRP